MWRNARSNSWRRRQRAPQRTSTRWRRVVMDPAKLAAGSWKPAGAGERRRSGGGTRARAHLRQLGAAEARKSA